MDEIVFNDIYDKYVNPVWRTALYYSGNQTDAEEITQLTFIQFLSEVSDSEQTKRAALDRPELL